MNSRYAIVKELPGTDYEEAVKSIVPLLKEEGFGVLTEIDVKATLKAKLDVDFRRYVILGACNPTFAHRALSAEPMVGVFLPCSVVVMERGGGGSVVAAFNPSASFSLAENSSVDTVAREVERSLRRALDKLRE